MAAVAGVILSCTYGIFHSTLSAKRIIANEMVPVKILLDDKRVSLNGAYTRQCDIGCVDLYALFHIVWLGKSLKSADKVTQRNYRCFDSPP